MLVYSPKEYCLIERPQICKVKAAKWRSGQFYCSNFHQPLHVKLIQKKSGL